MNQADNAKRVADFYDVLLSDFPRAVAEFLADDIEWVNPLPDGIPFGGTYKGIERLGEYFTELDAAIAMSPLHFTDIVGEGNVVSAIGVEEDTLVKSTGKRYTMPCVHVLRFNDAGRIEHVREYNDIREMVDAFSDA
jgi:ketosteroid isomerase-like protein